MHRSAIGEEGHGASANADGERVLAPVLPVVGEVDGGFLRGVNHHSARQQLDAEPQPVPAVFDAEKKSVVRSPGAEADHDGELLADLRREQTGRRSLVEGVWVE